MASASPSAADVDSWTDAEVAAALVAHGKKGITAGSVRLRRSALVRVLKDRMGLGADAAAVPAATACPPGVPGATMGGCTPVVLEAAAGEDAAATATCCSLQGPPVPARGGGGGEDATGPAVEASFFAIVFDDNAGTPHCTTADLRPCTCAPRTCPGVFRVVGPTRKFLSSFKRFRFSRHETQAGAQGWVDSVLKEKAQSATGTAEQQRQQLKDQQQPQQSQQQKQPPTSITMLANEKLPSQRRSSAAVSDIKRAAEDGNVERYLELVRALPNEYLLEDSNRGGAHAVPTVLHYFGDNEKARTNAIHCAARYGKHEIINAVLCEVDAYVQSVYVERLAALSPQPPSNAAVESLRTECSQLRDTYIWAYLNSPNNTKAIQTPLHLACCYGHVECVRYLVSLGDRVERHWRDVDGLTAEEVVCQKRPSGANWHQCSSKCVKPCDNAREDKLVKARLTEQIKTALRGRWYVPVVQDEACDPAQVGKPWSPDVSLTDLGASVRALAGPMNQSDAVRLYEQWTTPPKGQGLQRLADQLRLSLTGQGSDHCASPSNSEDASKTEEDRRLFQLRRSDPDKGLEQHGRVLAARQHVSWEEFWPFLNRMCNLGSEHGQQLLNHHFFDNGTNFIESDIPSPTDVDAFLAVITCGPLRAALENGSPPWAQAERFPKLWSWARNMHTRVKEQERLDVSASTETSEPGSKALKPRIPSSSPASHLKARLSGRGSIRKSAFSEKVASPLSPRRDSTTRSPKPSRAPASPCSKLSACTRLNACGFSRSLCERTPREAPADPVRTKLFMSDVVDQEQGTATPEAPESADLQALVQGLQEGLCL